MMQTFQALGDPTRQQIVEMLAAHGKLSAGDIVRHFEMSAPAISQHLKVLKSANLVTVEVKAQSRIYRVNPQGLTSAQEWISRMTRQWSERFDALDQLLEREKPKQPPARKRTKT